MVIKTEQEGLKLIILGAGSSVDCGLYPTGEQLVTIAEKLSSNGAEMEGLLKQTNPKEADLFWGCLKELIAARPSSIDAYITSIADGEKRRILKALIFGIITTSTAYSLAHSEHFKNNWYFGIWQLFERRLRGFKDVKKAGKIAKLAGKIKIITFNYDVSLELYLLDQLRKNFSDQNQNLVAKAFKKLCSKNIIEHVYGAIATPDEILEFDKKTEDQPQNDDKSQNKLDVGLGLVHIVTTIKSNLFSVKVISKMSELLGDNFTQFATTRPNNNSRFLTSTAFYSNALQVSFNLFLSDEGKDEQELKNLLLSRIEVMYEDRKPKPSILPSGYKCDLLYILGYGFDHDNNDLLNLDSIKWKNGCFVTNYGANQRRERVIYEQLSIAEARRDTTNPMVGIPYKIPLISHNSVKDALTNDFSLSEIGGNEAVQRIRTNLTPYLEMRKVNDVHSGITKITSAIKENKKL